MEIPIYIDLPVAPHVLKYLRFKYGQDPYDVCRDDLVGLLVHSLLDRMPSDLNLDPNSSGNVFRVQVGPKHRNTKGVFISKESAEVFNKAVDLEFREMLYQHVESGKRVKPKVKVKPLVQEFLEERGITEDDLKLETIMRQYRRIKKLQELDGRPRSRAFKNM